MDIFFTFQATSQMASKHIPAWKKIGLKLKYAKEDTEGDPLDKLPSAILEARFGTKKRRLLPNDELEGEDTVTQRAIKKSKSGETNVAVRSLSNGSVGPKGGSEGKESSLQITDETPTRKRKSVSFTSETKVEDGDSVKQTYKTWLSSQLAKDPFFFDGTTLNPALNSFTAWKSTISSTKLSDQASTQTQDQTLEPTSEPLSITPPSVKSQKGKRKQKHRPEKKKDKDLSQPDPPHLTYLQTYRTSPSNWKFSKTHQNHILKHILALRQIPSILDPTLLSYLKGLKGASARQRLRAQALGVRQEDTEWLSAEITEAGGSSKDGMMDEEPEAARHERRRREYEAQVKRIKDMLRKKEDEREDREWEYCGDKEEWEHRLKRRRRAEIVLWGVGETEEVEDAKPKDNRAAWQAKKASAGEPPGATWMLRPDALKVDAATPGPKKILFGEEPSTAIKAPNSSNGINGGTTGTGMNEINGLAQKPEPGLIRSGKKTRKRRAKKRTGVPDDDDSSSSSSSSSSEDGTTAEEREPVVSLEQQKQKEGRERVSAKHRPRRPT
ncbi:MAG: hypothetical protein Q9163_001548 [Psora crenata]